MRVLIAHLYMALTCDMCDKESVNNTQSGQIIVVSLAIRARWRSHVAVQKAYVDTKLVSQHIYRSWSTVSSDTQIIVYINGGAEVRTGNKLVFQCSCLKRFT